MQAMQPCTTSPPTKEDLALKPVHAHGDVIPFPAQPSPRKTSVVYINVFGKIATAIGRFWRQGDATRRKLCVLCTADPDEDFCLLAVVGLVDRGSCPMLSTVGLRQQH
jgi:hypothetical protein